MSKKKSLWLSFDLGVGGDYPGLYRWLDDMHAKECGSGVAYFEYQIEDYQEDQLVQIIRHEVNSKVNIRPGDRLYLIRMQNKNGFPKIMGDFIDGVRHPGPWEGYGGWRSELAEEGE